MGAGILDDEDFAAPGHVFPEHAGDIHRVPETVGAGDQKDYSVITPDGNRQHPFPAETGERICQGALHVEGGVTGGIRTVKHGEHVVRQEPNDFAFVCGDDRASERLHFAHFAGVLANPAPARRERTSARVQGENRVLHLKLGQDFRFHVLWIGLCRIPELIDQIEECFHRTRKLHPRDTSRA